MQMRPLGRTGLSVSILGFGCGAVGGLMVRGTAADRERAVAMALDAGVTYFDTAPQYGDGVSETHLGQVLATLKPDVRVGTKVRLADADRADIGAAVAASLEASLRRLGRDHVDLFQLHNPITEADAPGTLAAQRVLEEVVPAFERLVAAGKTRFFGITAIGETPAVLRVVESGRMFTGQVSYNLLNPSAGYRLPASYPAQDYDLLLARMAAAGMGAIGIRALAGGALSGEAERHAIASPPPAPIGSAQSYAADLARAGRLAPLVTEGYAASLVEAALRFVIAQPAISTALIGIATVEQFAAALAAVAKGPLPPAALDRAAALWAGFAGEAR
ncbi:MAG TPA: aldo/keto reductase [Acetobacteraceae bacterium]|nr:aldo/keto reductase [Acetobacteraceae bacterium]